MLAFSKKKLSFNSTKHQGLWLFMELSYVKETKKSLQKVKNKQPR